MQDLDKKQFNLNAVKRFLKSDVTLVLPGWALASAGFAAFVLLLAALD